MKKITTICMLFLFTALSTGCGLSGGYSKGDKVVVLPDSAQINPAFIEATVVSDVDNTVTVQIDNIREGRIRGMRTGELQQFKKNLVFKPEKGLPIAAARADFFDDLRPYVGRNIFRNPLGKC